MPTKHRSHGKKGQPEPRNKPVLWKWLLAVVLGPVLFLAWAELVLLLVGYGQPKGVFIR